MISGSRPFELVLIVITAETIDLGERMVELDVELVGIRGAPADARVVVEQRVRPGVRYLRQDLGRDRADTIGRNSVVRERLTNDSVRRALRCRRIVDEVSEPREIALPVIERNQALD